MRSGTIRIDKIVTDRQLDPDDNLQDLETSLAQTGQKVPVLLDGSNQLVDGLRRICALVLLGEERAQCVWTDNLDESVEHLHRAHTLNFQDTARPLSAHRSAAILKVLHLQKFERLRNHRKLRTGNGRDFKLPPLKAANQVIADALGVSRSYLDSVQVLWNAARSGSDYGEAANRLIADIARGVTTPQLAVRRLYRASKDIDLAVTEKEQRQILNGIIITLSSINRTIDRVQELHMGLGVDELQQWETQLRDLISPLRTTLGTLRRTRKGRSTP